ncbi:flagellar hook capping FlgD N-terminal domain-containing protein [Dactylosporangium sp. NPDC051541]|uniref:flagellar hook capping FlgD N-terminal domain-containing protein n=1 Tax=Dactylosporangium sp. NPDC051541 TaxID=3363977 RepID=UPI00379FE095
MPKTNAPTKKSDSDGLAKPGGELGKDAFLKLLVTQLKYQDPSNPMDNREFLAQTAQFTTVEKLNDLAETQQSLLSAQLQLGASALIGKTVTYTDKENQVHSGIVSSAKFFTGAPPTLRVGDTDVALAAVTEIGNQAPQGPQATTPAQASAQAGNQAGNQGSAQAGNQATAPAQTGGQATAPAQNGGQATVPAQNGQPPAGQQQQQQPGQPSRPAEAAS